MFDLFRSREKSVRILLGVLLGLVALSMLVYLIPGGPGGGISTGQNTVATVGDQQITTDDVRRAVDRLTQNQPNVPKALIAMYLPSVVDQMVQGKAMAYKATQMGLRVTDQELGDSIQSEFAAQLGGKFDMKIYEAVLQQQGMTVPDFERDRREAMLAARLAALEQQSLVITDSEAKAEYQRKNLKVGLQYLAFDQKSFASKVNKDPAALKAYFEKNRNLFRIPEKKDVDLIVGTTAEFLQTANVSDQQLHQEYQDNIDSYRIPERVKVRHILIKTQGKPKDEVPKLKAKAEDILKQLQHGANFADLAKKNSEDPGSAEKGGELDWIVRGQTVPSFEKAAFSLQPGQLSGLVETEYGYHILQVEDRQNAHVQSFDEVKPQILATLQKQVATDHLTHAIDSARAEIAKNPSQAEAIAKKYNLRFYRINGYTPGSPLPDVSTQQQVISAVASAGKGAVTEVQTIQGQGKSAFGVVTNVIPSRNADFAEVQGEVAQKYTEAESIRLAQQAAKEALARAKKGESLETLAKTYDVPLKTASPFTIDGAAEGIGSATLLQSAFKANVNDVIGPISAQSADFVCKVTTKIPADMSQFAKNRDAIVQSLQTDRQRIQDPLFQNSVVAELKRKGKIKYNQGTIDRMVEAFRS
jgi:peptidyl-prolyl cis-trans isomerase D